VAIWNRRAGDARTIRQLDKRRSGVIHRNNAAQKAA
jgi:hypothetical protein